MRVVLNRKMILVLPTLKRSKLKITNNQKKKQNIREKQDVLRIYNYFIYLHKLQVTDQGTVLK